MTTNRRNAIKAGALALGGLAFNPIANALSQQSISPKFISKRPPLKERKFVSEAVEAKIKEVKKAIKNEELAWLFENCFPNTLDTTVTTSVINGKADTFVITGDINAMWLRDSTAQVWPYLPLIKNDPKLKTLIQGVVIRQAKCVLLDPYANAFHFDPNQESGWGSDLTDHKKGVSERKWEIDSLCYVIRLAYGYWKTNGDISIFDQDWIRAMKLIVKTFKEQQKKENEGPYFFERKTQWTKDTAQHNPLRPIGLISSDFRPSDDSTILQFLIPSNLFAVVSLQQLKEIFLTLGDREFASECELLSKEVQEAIQRHAMVSHLNYGKIYCFETDGYGNRIFMEDANVPSLLSLPYLGVRNDEVYQNTRKFVWSMDNPWFFKGRDGEGIGGPHIGKDMIWPISVIMYALTSNDVEEIKKALFILTSTHAGTGFMHESFHKNDPGNYTRKWFAWANTLFGELILKLYNERKEVLGMV